MPMIYRRISPTFSIAPVGYYLCFVLLVFYSFGLFVCLLACLIVCLFSVCFSVTGKIVVINTISILYNSLVPNRFRILYYYEQ